MRAETAPFTGFFDTTKLQVEAGGMASEPVTWHSGNNTVPFFTLVISLNNGAIESMEWDRGCFGCIGASSACSAERFCTELYCEQPNAQGQPRNCDVKVYVAWIGTDSRGTFMTSAGQRFSNFRSYSINRLYQNTVTEITDSFDGSGDGTGESDPLK